MSYLSDPASTTEYGVVKVGSGISVTDGVISTSGGGGSITGTWTPSITSSAGGTITLTIAQARYVKIGQFVNCIFDFTIATETGGSNNGILTLNNLPFTSISGTGYVGNLTVSYFEILDTNETYITGTITGNSTQVLLWSVHQATSSTRLLQSDIRPTTRLVGNIIYISAI